MQVNYKAIYIFLWIILYAFDWRVENVFADESKITPEQEITVKSKIEIEENHPYHLKSSGSSSGGSGASKSRSNSRFSKPRRSGDSRGSSGSGRKFGDRDSASGSGRKFGDRDSSSDSKRKFGDKKKSENYRAFNKSSAPKRDFKNK